MTLNEASHRFHISLEKLSFYEENGRLDIAVEVPGVENSNEWCEPVSWVFC